MRKIVADGGYRNITPYGRIAKWTEDGYDELEIKATDEYKPLSQLYGK